MTATELRDEVCRALLYATTALVTFVAITRRAERRTG